MVSISDTEKKVRLSVYLDPGLMRSLADYAARREQSRSLVAEAAVASFLSPDADERREATIAKRLDSIDRRAQRLERDMGTAVEMMAVFVRFWLASTPQLPDAVQAARPASGTIVSWMHLAVAWQRAPSLGRRSERRWIRRRQPRTLGHKRRPTGSPLADTAIGSCPSSPKIVNIVSAMITRCSSDMGQFKRRWTLSIFGGS